MAWASRPMPAATFPPLLDVRKFSSAIHRVELLARDTSGNLATLSANVAISPTPPPTPQITAPAVDLVVNAGPITMSGTAEPLIEVRLFRSGSLAGGHECLRRRARSHFPNEPLLEGLNSFSAQAIDAIGTASSRARVVTLDTVPPAQLVMDAPTYLPGLGLALTWHFPDHGQRASAPSRFSGAPVPLPAPPRRRATPRFLGS